MSFEFLGMAHLGEPELIGVYRFLHVGRLQASLGTRRRRDVAVGRTHLVCCTLLAFCCGGRGVNLGFYLVALFLGS